MNDKLVCALLETPGMRARWDADDRGMPVFVHSLDVALLALDRASRLDREVVALAALVHDASKAPFAPALQLHARIISSAGGRCVAALLDEDPEFEEWMTRTLFRYHRRGLQARHQE